MLHRLLNGDGSRAGLWGAISIFHVKSFVTLLLAIGNIAIWGCMAHTSTPPLDLFLLLNENNKLPFME